MALTLNLAVFPVVAGLLAGTGAMATYATSPADVKPAPQAVALVQPQAAAPVIAAPAPQAAAPCETQAWPYLDANCAAKRAGDERRVRVVSAPRQDELPTASHTPPAIPHVANPQPPVSAPLPGNMQSRSTVLYSPDIVVPKATKRERRADRRKPARERRWTAQSYQVPSEDRGVRPVIVVRPLPLQAYR